MREIIEGEGRESKKKIEGAMKKYFRSHTYEGKFDVQSHNKVIHAD